MKKLLLAILLLTSLNTNAQTIESYFNSIRNNPAALTAFFSQMPKGGDLHNHFHGSVYAETFINYAVDQDYAINGTTLEVLKDIPKDKNGKLIHGWSHFSALGKQNRLPAYKQMLIQKWSTKDYNGVSHPSDKQFFETFPAFDIAIQTDDRFDTGLLEMKRRAQKENVSYIETMFRMVNCDKCIVDGSFTTQLLDAQQNRDEKRTQAILEKIYQQVTTKGGLAAAADHNTYVSNTHNRLHIDDETFTMRYQNYVLRVMPPAEVFKSLVLAFASASTSALIVGVNIVAPEDNEVSMRDYWLHMQMYKFCHAKFPNVKYAMHAGELALGMVKPEELSWHINAAVHTAGASRIGHGVDIAYETRPYDLLTYMTRNDVAVEINLYSNEFILKVKNGDHPISLYRDFHVPIVICTDDAGVLRSNLTHQYVLLASRYPDVSYRQIKEYVYNSITYSFIKDERLKQQLKTQLKERFNRFEKEVIAAQQNK